MSPNSEGPSQSSDPTTTKLSSSTSPSKPQVDNNTIKQAVNVCYPRTNRNSSTQQLVPKYFNKSTFNNISINKANSTSIQQIQTQSLPPALQLKMSSHTAPNAQNTTPSIHIRNRR